MKICEDPCPIFGFRNLIFFYYTSHLLTVIRIIVTGLLSQHSPIRTPSFESHLADLLGNKAHHEDDNGGHKQEYTHIGESTLGEIRIKVIDQSSQKHDETDGQKDPHW